MATTNRWRTSGPHAHGGVVVSDLASSGERESVSQFVLLRVQRLKKGVFCWRHMRPTCASSQHDYARSDGSSARIVIRYHEVMDRYDQLGRCTERRCG